MAEGGAAAPSEVHYLPVMRVNALLHLLLVVLFLRKCWMLKEELCWGYVEQFAGSCNVGVIEGRGRHEGARIPFIALDSSGTSATVASSRYQFACTRLEVDSWASFVHSCWNDGLLRFGPTGDGCMREIARTEAVPVTNITAMMRAILHARCTQYASSGRTCNGRSGIDWTTSAARASPL